MPKNFIINLYLALWRVLVIDKCGSATPRLSSSRRRQTDKKTKLGRASKRHPLPPLRRPVRDTPFMFSIQRSLLNSIFFGVFSDFPPLFYFPPSSVQYEAIYPQFSCVFRLPFQCASRQIYPPQTVFAEFVYRVADLAQIFSVMRYAYYPPFEVPQRRSYHRTG